MLTCDIPGKCSVCGEHVYCINARYWTRKRTARIVGWTVRLLVWAIVALAFWYGHHK